MGKQWSDVHQAFIETDPPPVRQGVDYWHGGADMARRWLDSARAAHDLEGEAEALQAIRTCERLRGKAGGSK